jgi:hypothetical protein
MASLTHNAVGLAVMLLAMASSLPHARAADDKPITWMRTCPMGECKATSAGPAPAPVCTPTTGGSIYMSVCLGRGAGGVLQGGCSRNSKGWLLCCGGCDRLWLIGSTNFDAELDLS